MHFCPIHPTPIDGEVFNRARTTEQANRTKRTHTHTKPSKTEEAHEISLQWNNVPGFKRSHSKLFFLCLLEVSYGRRHLVAYVCSWHPYKDAMLGSNQKIIFMPRHSVPLSSCTQSRLALSARALRPQSPGAALLSKRNGIPATNLPSGTQ